MDGHRITNGWNVHRPKWCVCEIPIWKNVLNFHLSYNSMTCSTVAVRPVSDKTGTACCIFSTAVYKNELTCNVIFKIKIAAVASSIRSKTYHLYGFGSLWNSSFLNILSFSSLWRWSFAVVMWEIETEGQFSYFMLLPEKLCTCRSIYHIHSRALESPNSYLVQIKYDFVWRVCIS